MMFCDVRYMHPDDVLPMWLKVRRHLHRADCTFDDDDGEYFMRIEGLRWTFDSHARGFRFDKDGVVSWENAVVFISYYPPGGGNIRFDSHVYATPRQPMFRLGEDGKNNPVVPDYQSSCPQLVREYAEALVKYGGQGKNRLSAFEDVSSPAASSLPERAWWKFW